MIQKKFLKDAIQNPEIISVFIFGVFLGWLAKGWSDKHVS